MVRLIPVVDRGQEMLMHAHQIIHFQSHTVYEDLNHLLSLHFVHRFFLLLNNGQELQLQIRDLQDISCFNIEQIKVLKAAEYDIIKLAFHLLGRDD